MAASHALRLGYVNLGGIREATWSPLLQVCRDAMRDHCQFDIICIGETWFHSVDCATAWNIDGYQHLVHLTRPAPQGRGRGHGGISVYINDHFRDSFGTISFREDVSSGIIWLEIPRCKLVIAVCYLAHPTSTWLLRAHNPLPPLLEGLTSAHGRGFMTVLIGDLNAHIGSLDHDVPGENDLDYAPPSPACYDLHAYAGIPKPRLSSDPRIDSRGLELLDLLRACQMVLLNGRAPGNNSGPTFTSATHATTGVLDYACISASSYSHVHDLHFINGWSEHCLLSLSFTPLCLPPPCLRRSVFRVYRPPMDTSAQVAIAASRLAAFEGALQSLWSDMQAGLSLAESLHRLTPIICHVADVRPPRSSPHTSSWWDDTCAQAKLQVREAYWAYLRLRRRLHGVSADQLSLAREHFTHLRSSYKSLCRSKKCAWEAARETSLVDLALSHPRRFWRSWGGPTSSRLLLTDVGPWTTHFQQVLQHTTPASMSAETEGLKQVFLDRQVEQLHCLQHDDPTYLSELNADLTASLVSHCLHTMHRHRAADSQGLTVEALQFCWMQWLDPDPLLPSPSPLPPSCSLFRQCLCHMLQRMWEDPWPDVLCSSTLTPIPKGVPSMAYDQHRGIAVSSVFTKLHEYILHTVGDTASERHHMRAPTQCGFRRGKGTLDAIFTLNHLVTRARHKKARLYVVFVDFQKAFDLVPRDELIARCCRLGFHGRFIHALLKVYARVLYQVRVDH